MPAGTRNAPFERIPVPVDASDEIPAVVAAVEAVVIHHNCAPSLVGLFASQHSALFRAITVLIRVIEDDEYL